MDRPASLGLLRPNLCCTVCKRFQTRTLDPACNHRVCFDCVEGILALSSSKSELTCKTCNQLVTLPPNYFRMRGYSVQAPEPRMHVYCSTTSETKRLSPPRLSSITNTGVTTECSSCHRPCSSGSSVPDCGCHLVTVFPSSVKAVVRGDSLNGQMPPSVSAQAGTDGPNFELRQSMGEPSFGIAAQYPFTTTMYPPGTTTSTIMHQPLQRTSSSSPLPQGRSHKTPLPSDPSRSGHSSTGHLPPDTDTETTAGNQTAEQQLKAALDQADRERTQREQQDRERAERERAEREKAELQRAEWARQVEKLQAEVARERLAREEAEERLAREHRANQEAQEREAREQAVRDQKERERKQREEAMIKDWENLKNRTQESQKALEKEILELKSAKENIQKEIRNAEDQLTAYKNNERSMKERIDKLEDDLQEKKLSAQNDYRNKLEEMNKEYAERRKVAESEFADFRKRQEQSLQDEISLRRAALEKEESEFQKRKDKWQEDWNRVIEEAANIEREAKKARDEQVKRFLEEQRQARENWENQEKEWNKKKLEWFDKETEWHSKQKQNQRVDEEWIAMDKRRKELLEIEQKKQQEELQEQLKIKKLLKSTKPSQMRPDRMTKLRPAHSDFGPLNSQSASTNDNKTTSFWVSDNKSATISGFGTSWIPRTTASTGFDMAAQAPATTKKDVTVASNAKKTPMSTKSQADQPSNTIPAQPIPLSAKLDRVSALAGIGTQSAWAAAALQGFTNLSAQLQNPLAPNGDTPSASSAGLQQSQAPNNKQQQQQNQPKSILRNPQTTTTAAQTPAPQRSASHSRKKFTPSPGELVKTLLVQNQARRSNRGVAAGNFGGVKGQSASAARIKMNNYSEQRPRGNTGRGGLFAIGDVFADGIGSDQEEPDWKSRKIRSRSGGRAGDRNSKSLRTLTREAEAEAQFFENKFGVAGLRSSLDQAEEARLRAELFGTGREKFKHLSLGIQSNSKCCEGGLCSHAFVYPGPFLNKYNSALSTLESGALQRELIRESRCLDHT